MCTGGENSVYLCSDILHGKASLKKKKKKKKKNPDLSTHIVSGMLPETFLFFFLALLQRHYFL